MQYLSVLIDESGKAELKMLLDEHSVTWHESKVLKFSVGAADIVNFILQGGVVGSVAAVIIKWLNVRENRRFKAHFTEQGKLIEIDSNHSIEDIERILKKHNLYGLEFIEPTQPSNIDGEQNK